MRIGFYQPTNQPTNNISLLRELAKLSRRESEVLEKVVEGKKNREIGEELYISRRTVENTRARICKKWGLEGRGALNKWIETHLK